MIDTMNTTINATRANCSLGLSGGMSPLEAVAVRADGVEADGNAGGGGSVADERDHRDSVAGAAGAFVIGLRR